MADVRRPSADFWSGKRVLVLGHTGFKGAWLSLWLRRLGAKVEGISLPAEEPSLFVAAGLKYVLLTAVLFAPGTILYFWARREQNARMFTSVELAIFAVVLIGAAIGVIGLATGLITP